MTKQETQIMKGVAILLMIFLHLFNHMENVELCQSYFYINGMPFVHWLSASTNPVAFFLILSGYGMHYIHLNKKNDTHRWSRIGKLYMHWGVILLIFTVPVFAYREVYYTDLQYVISNYTAFHTTWYGEAWFLFPFICLSLLSPFIFRITDRLKAKWILIIVFFIGTCTSFIISRYGSQYLYNNYLIYNPFLIIHLAPSFLFGAMMQRSGIIEKFKEKYHGKCNWIGLMVIVTVMCVTRTAAWGPLYASAFIILFLAAPRWKWIDNTLVLLGNHSMNMWLIHAWFCYYIFHDEVYALRYPLLIFAALTVVSLICSYIVNAVCNLISLSTKICQRKK